MATRKKQTFEQGMEQLEQIVRQLEQSDVPLEQSIALFEQGMTLSATLQDMLKNAEQKVSVLTQDDDDSLSEIPLVEEED